MALGSLISIKKKLSNKDLSWVADLGWLVAIVAMYLLALYLVIGEKLAIKPIFVPVSYTHRDVYKRQPLRNIQERSQKKCMYRD